MSKKEMAGITIRIPVDKRLALNQLAESTGMSAGSMIRSMIYKMLAESNQKRLSTEPSLDKAA